LPHAAFRVAGGGMPQYVKGPSVAIATAILFDAFRRGVFGEIEVARYPHRRGSACACRHCRSTPLRLTILV
jgi:hypothetical protein